MKDLKMEEFLEYLREAMHLEEKLSSQEKQMEEYAPYREEPVKPERYKNVASLGMITLPIAWIIFDAFAFFTGYTRIGWICSGVTLALVAFVIVMKVREKRLNEETVKRYQNYVEKHELMKRLEEENLQTREALGKLYAKEYLYPRFQNYQALKAIYEYIVSGECTALSGPDSVFNLYEKNRSR